MGIKKLILAPGWTVGIEARSRSDVEALACLLPAPVETAAAIDRRRHLVFADLDRADGTSLPANLDNVVFLFDHPRFQEDPGPLLRHKICALLDRRLLTNLPLIQTMVDAISGPHRRLELAHLAKNALTRFPIRSSSDREAFFEQILGEFAAAGMEDQTAASLRLVMCEFTTNALIHAFEEERGVRYEPDEFDVLEEQDEIVVEYELNDNTFLLKVKDNAGSLDPGVVRLRIHRQLSGEGLLDTSGRGFFLGFSIATLIAVNLVPGIATEVIMVFDRREEFGGSALLINVESA